MLQHAEIVHELSETTEQYVVDAPGTRFTAVPKVHFSLLVAMASMQHCTAC